MIQKVKDWLLLILLAIVSVLSAILLARKPQWVKEKEKEVEQRKEAIKKAKAKVDQIQNNYNELKKQHDNEIEKAGGDIEAEKHNNANAAADGINDFIFGDGSD